VGRDGGTLAARVYAELFAHFCPHPGVVFPRLGP
jgi:hypothetical protein